MWIVDKVREVLGGGAVAPQVENMAVSGVTSAVASSSPQIVEMLGGVSAASGIYVTPESAQRASSVYACCDKIAGSISSLPIRLYRRTKNGQRGGREEIESSDLVSLLNERPSSSWTAADAKSKSILYVLLRGDSFWLIRRNRMGVVKELIPLPWEAVLPFRKTSSFSERNTYAVSDGMETKGYDQDDILHFAGYGFNGLFSMSVISYGAKNAVGNSLAMDQYSGQFFSGGAHASIVVKQEAGSLDQKKVDFLKDQFREKYAGLRNAHANPLILPPGMGVENVTLTAQDTQLLEARKFQVIDICRAFGVPPHMVGETSASTSWGSGIESINRGFLTYTLNPRIVKMEEEFNYKLLAGTDMFVEFDRSSMLEGDAKTQAEFFRSALGGPGAGPGWMTTNEVRARRNLPPVDGGDELFDPNNGKDKGNEDKDS